MNPIRRYARTKLHRRIFIWFGVSIALTVAIASGLAALTSDRTAWRKDIDRAELFLGHQLAQVWHSPEKRDRLLAGMARDFEANVIAYDASGHRIGGQGNVCHHPFLNISVSGESSTDTKAEPGAELGRVEVCRDFDYRRSGWIFLLVLATAGACLWMASGVIARRLIRPLRGVVGVARDIGDGKLDSRVTIGCRHRSDELGVLANAINDMAERIEKQMADQRELLAAVSHELRTPLGHMRVLIDIVRDTNTGDEALTSRIDELESEVLEVDSLVGQLLASSRLAFDTLDRRPLDAREIALRALERAGLPESILSIDVGEASDTTFAGDPTLLARALANLLANAKSHGQGVVSLRITESEGETEAKNQDSAPALKFEILDQGPGFADGEDEKVFTTFYRGAHRAGQSSLGLGLALVARIAKAHDGQPFAKNRPEGGAIVGFTVSRE